MPQGDKHPAMFQDSRMDCRQWKEECEKIKERFLREKLAHIKIDL